MSNDHDKSLFYRGFCSRNDVGFYFIADAGRKVIHLCFTTNKHNNALEQLQYMYKTVKVEERKQISEWICQQFDAYINGEETLFSYNIQSPFLKIGTDFQQKVWKAIHQIDYGKTKSYCQIAEALGNRNLARAVGGACNKNPLALIIPCHRVIGAKGLGGFAGGKKLKKKLLAIEQG